MKKDDRRMRKNEKRRRRKNIRRRERWKESKKIKERKGCVIDEETKGRKEKQEERGRMKK